MKYLLLVFTAAIFYSCSKDPAAPPRINASGLIQYKVNGTDVAMNNVAISSDQFVVCYKQPKGIAPKTRYLLTAQNGANNLLVFPIVTDSLHEMNYHYDSAVLIGNPAAFAFSLKYTGQTSTIFYHTDNFDVNISAYKNGLISGTFAGKFTPYSQLQGVSFEDRGKIIISEGKIDNVPVIYWYLNTCETPYNIKFSV